MPKHSLQDSVQPLLYRIAVLLLCALLGVGQAGAGSMILLGAGGGAVASTYVGPGDTFTTSPYAAYSCSEAFTAAYASGLNAACDVVDTATGVTTCTFHFQANGKVNATECNATACATACSVKQAYDQTGNGRHALQATLANMPGLTFSSTPLGTLPAINCTLGTNALLQTSASFTQAQPMTLSAVLIRSSGTAEGGAIGGISGSSFAIGPAVGANLAEVQFGLVVSAAATDNQWYSLGGLANGASGAINVNGSDTTGNSGSNSLSTSALRVCRGNGLEVGGLIAEAMIWAASSTSTNRNSISSNQHSSGRYNF